VTLAILPAVAPPFQWRERNEIVWLAASLPNATAAFSTRLGGMSEGPYATLNLGILTDDDPDRVRENRRRLVAALGRDADGVVMGRQVHETAVQVQRERPPQTPVTAPAVLAEADAQLTDHENLTPLVLVADCLPLVLSAGDGVGVVHCGWRGIVKGIVAKALASLWSLTGVSANGTSAAIGPGIGPCCYEVGAAVTHEFERAGLNEAIDGARLDLAAAVRSQLLAAGVPNNAIASAALCTSCNPDLFFSHRRDCGTTGRQAGLVWRTG
jgi:polyphenol oxidase